MKISKVIANNHKHAWEVVPVGAGNSMTWLFPYSRAKAVPTAKNPIVELYVDPELDREGFTYKLESGVEDSVLMDQVLDYNSDPDYVSKMDVYNLTVAAKRRFESSDLSVREVARLMRTSPTQVYRLLDTTNPNKTMKQMLVFLRVLGFKPKIQLTPTESLSSSEIEAALSNASELVERLNVESKAIVAAATAAASEDLARIIAAQRETAEELVRRITDDVNRAAASASEAVRQISAKSSTGKTLRNPRSGVYRSRSKSDTYQLVGPRDGKQTERAAARKR